MRPEPESLIEVNKLSFMQKLQFVFVFLLADNQTTTRPYNISTDPDVSKNVPTCEKSIQSLTINWEKASTIIIEFKKATETEYMLSQIVLDRIEDAKGKLLTLSVNMFYLRNFIVFL